MKVYVVVWNDISKNEDEFVLVAASGEAASRAIMEKNKPSWNEHGESEDYWSGRYRLLEVEVKE